MMTEQEIRDGVADRKWFHNIQLPYGIVTPGTREPDAWQTYKLPEKLDGLRVLDIGAWEGGFSFESERRGASSVTAMDVWNRTNEPGSGGYGWENFQFCHRVLGSGVKTWNMNVYDLDALDKRPHDQDDVTFDMILFLEVLYHLQDPLRAIRNIRNRLAKNGMVCLETWIDAEWIEEPAAIFYPGAELAGDPTNWWGPNIKCVQSWAIAAGFAACELVWSKNDVHLGGRGKRACFHIR